MLFQCQILMNWMKFIPISSVVHKVQLNFVILIESFLKIVYIYADKSFLGVSNLESAIKKALLGHFLMTKWCIESDMHQKGSQISPVSFLYILWTYILNN